MNNYQLHMIPAFNDNYIWLLELADKKTLIIDPGQALPVIDYIQKNQLQPIAILLTHHHNDHIGGVTELQQKFADIVVYGPDEINLPITHITGQTSLTIANQCIEIIDVPGHTLGHVAYYLKPYLFSGDVIFSAGCGRIFEGTHQQMLNSLNTLKQLPEDTIICAAHEYTLSNLRFAKHMLPDDQVIDETYQQVQTLKVTLPTTLKKELTINLFLKCNEVSLQKRFNINNELDLFTYLRTQKDKF